VAAPAPIEPGPIEINTDIPQRPIVPPLEVPPLVQQEREWSQMDEIGRLGEVAANRRNAPVEDVPRWKAALATILRNLGHVNSRPLERGESAAARIIGNVAGSGIVGAAVPGIEGQARKDVNVAQAETDYQRAIEAQKQVIAIEGDMSRNDERLARIPGILAKPILERDKFEQKKDFDGWRQANGDRRADSYEDWLEWRKENGDRTTKTREDYLKWQQDIGERRLEQQKELGVAGIELRRESNDIRRESNNIRREGSAGTSTGVPPVVTSKASAAAQRLLDKERTFRARAASARTPEAAAEFNRIADEYRDDAANLGDVVEVQETPAVKVGGVVAMKGSRQVKMKPRTAQRAIMPAIKLSENEIRAKFPNDRGKADEAVRRAKIKGWL
jgi:hypothetical protein